MGHFAANADAIIRSRAIPRVYDECSKSVSSFKNGGQGVFSAGANSFQSVYNYENRNNPLNRINFNRRGIMAVSVIIRREFKDTEKATELAPLIVKLRSLATIQPGYITGRTFRCIDCPGEFLVISTWNSVEDWNRWLNSPERRSIQDRVDTLLEAKTEYTLYEPLVGGIIPKI